MVEAVISKRLKYLMKERDEKFSFGVCSQGNFWAWFQDEYLSKKTKTKHGLIRDYFKTLKMYEII